MYIQGNVVLGEATGRIEIGDTGGEGSVPRDANVTATGWQPGSRRS